MNSESKWRQLNGNIKAAFGKLTDDDLVQADGDTEKMMGALQKRYGYTKSKAQTEWNSFAQQYVTKINKVEDVDTDIDAAVNALKATTSPRNDTV